MNALRRYVFAFGIVCLVVPTAAANELWIPPTYQQDFGGAGIGSSGVWPVTIVGVVRLAWAVPDDLHAFRAAKLALIPHAPAGPGTLVLRVCHAASGEFVAAACTGPHSVPYTGTANQLLEIDVTAAITSHIGVAGANHIAVLAYTTPQTRTDHVAGLRFVYDAPPLPTAALADEAVTAEKIAPNTIDSSKLTFSPVTHTELALALTGVRLTSLDGLNGLICSVNGTPGTTALTIATDGQVSLKCNTPPPPPPDRCCEITDPKLVSKFTPYLTQIQSVALPRLCIGSMIGLGTGFCIDSATLAINWDGLDISSELVGTELYSDHEFVRQFDVAPHVFTVDYRIVGVGGSCQLTVGAPNTRLSEIVRSDMISSPEGPLHHVAAHTRSVSMIPDVSGCGLLASLEVVPTLQEALEQLAVQVLGMQPICWEPKADAAEIVLTVCP